MCKPFHAGRASEAGVLAALLAENGFTSAEEILEGAGGFFQTMKGAVREEVVQTLGQTWMMEHLAQKYHASCHGTHSAIEVVLNMVKKDNLDVHAIKSINIQTTRTAINIAGKKTPKTGLEGKFSIYYCVANALLRGDTGMQAFTDEKVNDPEIKPLMEKISITAVPDSSLLGLAAKVEVETHAGKVLQGFNDILNEIPELQTKRKKVQIKYMDLCGPVLGRKQAEELMTAFLTLDDRKNMKDLMEGIQAINS